jgi:hypothetical protein
LIGQGLCDGEADASRCGCDECSLAVETKIHFFAPSFSIASMGFEGWGRNAGM